MFSTQELPSLIKILYVANRMVESSVKQDAPIILNLETNDSDEMAEFIRGWDHEYVQLQRGKFSWKIDIIQIGEFQIYEEILGGRTLNQGLVPPGTCVVAFFPNSSPNDGKFLGQEIAANVIVTGNYRQQYEFISGEQYKVVVMAAPVDSVLNLAEKMQRPLKEAQLFSQGIIIPNSRAYTELSRYLQEVLHLTRTQPTRLTNPIEGKLLGRLIQEDALPLFIDVLTAKPLTFLPEKDSKRRCLVKQTEAFMRENIKHPISLTDLCQNIDQSQRSLYYAFQGAYGLSPMQYLKILRLNSIRRILKSADPKETTVTEIAIEWGFWHAGQFSVDYKKMFGETPSATLKSDR